MASMFWKILEELECSLNFTTEIVSEMHEYGLWNEKDQTWSGLMGEIVAGRADFAVADMSMTSFRIHYVDFTLPLIVSRNNLYIKEPGICGVKWLSYFQVIWLITVKIMGLSLSRCYENNRWKLRTDHLKHLINFFLQLIWTTSNIKNKINEQ